MSQQINLLNPLFFKQREYFSALRMLQALGLLLLGMGLFYLYLLYHIRILGAQTTQIDQLNTDAQHQLTSLGSSIHTPSQILLDQIVKSEQTARNQQLILQWLHSGELGNQTGFSSYFTALSRQTIDGLWLTGFTVVGLGDEMQLNGRALQANLIAKLIQHLGNEPEFAGTHFAMLSIYKPVEITDTANKDNKVKPLPYIEFTLNKTGAGPEK